MSYDIEKSVSTYLTWTAQIVLATLGVTTIHYIGFFSTFSSDYFSLVSANLSKRVAWELISALSFTSLFSALLFLAFGLFKSMWMAGKSLLDKKQKQESEKQTGSVSLMPKALAGYVGMLTVMYVPYDINFFDRTVYIVFIVIIIFIGYVNFFHKNNENTKWSRFVAHFRKKELGISALIAVIFLVPFLMGKGLAWSLLNAEPKKIFSTNGEIRVIILDITDTMLLIKTDNGIELLPLHQVQKIIW